MATVLEVSNVAPKPDAAVMELPLSMFDMMWIRFHPIRRLLFYQYPCSSLEFTETLLFRLKESLSITLKHFPPVAGNLMYPQNKDNKPVLRYLHGDSVTLTADESTADFDELVGNHFRDADQFYDFIPSLPEVVEEEEHQKVAMFAVKVTHFPGRGICVGVANHHCVGDGNSIFKFITTWVSICKLAGEEEFRFDNSPIFDRYVIHDPLGIATIYWKIMRDHIMETSPFPLPTGRVSASFILTSIDIKNLKEMVLDKKPSLTYISSLVVTACYTWNCLIKSLDSTGEKVSRDADEILVVPADLRSRIEPPVPESYFGNCLGPGFGDLNHVVHTGENGFAAAVERIADLIKNKVNNKEEVLKGAENWFLPSEQAMYKQKRFLGISGSPRYDLYGVDFGWGRARKVEILSIDGEKYAFSLCKLENGNLEIGLSLPEKQIVAFAAILSNGLRS